MTLTKSPTLLRDIRQAQPDWFSRDNKRFFNDVEYRGYYGKKTGKAYLVRSTYAWTDMFDQPKRLHYRINELNQDTLEVESLIGEEFKDIFTVKAWLDEHWNDLRDYQPQVELRMNGNYYKMTIRDLSILKDVIRVNKVRQKRTKLVLA